MDGATLNVVGDPSDLLDDDGATTEDVLLDKIDEQTLEIDGLTKSKKYLTRGLIGLGILFVGVLIWALSANS